MPSYKFLKKERLTNKKRIAQLFSSGLSINAYPLRLIYLTATADQQSELQFAFTVPKRLFKKAVQRNFLKRKIKEAFRLNKHEIKELVTVQNQSIYGIIIYIDKSPQEYAVIERSMKKLIKKLSLKFS
jgi:ribonuclease P protein component